LLDLNQSTLLVTLQSMYEDNVMKLKINANAPIKLLCQYCYVEDQLF